jgi:hypothetical protein
MASTEIVILVLFAVSLIVVPSLLAWAIFSLVKADRQAVGQPGATSTPRSSRRRDTGSRSARPASVAHRFRRPGWN